MSASPAPSGSEWCLASRVAFRFAFIYLAIYCLPFPLDIIPGASVIDGWYYEVWQAVIPWIAKHILGLATDITIFTNGSGDTTYDYLRSLVMAVMAAIGTVVWSFTGRGSRAHPKLYECLHIYLRYVLGYAMLSYGLAKVFLVQFSQPDYDRLIQQFGEASPMGLLWTMMGYSKGYQIFAGLGEVVGGVLLLWRRTTTLGALIVAGVMLNVVMLNFCFDVPVKLYASHLLAMAILLAMEDAKALVNVLVLRRPGVPSEPYQLFPGSKARKFRIVSKSALLLAMFGSLIWVTYTDIRDYGAGAPEQPHHGPWIVEEFHVTENAETAAMAEEKKWHRVVFRDYGGFAVQTADLSMERFRVEDDPEKGTLNIMPRYFTPDGDGKPLYTWSYEETTADRMTVKGEWKGVPIEVVLRKEEPRSFPLTERGFHWINERPNNN